MGIMQRRVIEIKQAKVKTAVSVSVNFICPIWNVMQDNQTVARMRVMAYSWW
jgi:hypothetical protein